MDCLSLCGFFGHGLREEIELFLQWTTMTQREGLRISETPGRFLNYTLLYDIGT